MYLPNLVMCYLCMHGLCLFQTFGADFNSDLGFGCMYFLRKCAYRDINVSYEFPLNKQKYGTKITCIELWGKDVVIRKVVHFFSGVLHGLASIPPLINCCSTGCSTL